jgi:hypothetical protein
MKTRSFVSGIALCLALGGVASAGFKQPWAVTIDPVNRTAMGSLGTARNSPDSNQSIGCGVSYDSVNRKNNVNCSAMDSTGHTAQCATQQAELIQIALGINGDSFLQFNWNGDECTNIIVFNSSIYAPKQP